MRAAVIQMNSGAVVADNLRSAGQLLEEAAAQGAQLAVLPENFSIMPARRAQRLAAAEVAGDGPAQTWLADTARTLGMWLVGGTMPIVDPDAHERVRAASLVAAPDGRITARYDKLHLFDVDAGEGEQYRESASFSPGQHAVVSGAGGAELGLSVCYDVRFPELYRALSAAGATVLTAPSAFTLKTGRAHWQCLMRARAVENLCFMLAPNQCGTHADGRQTWGESLIVSPWGEVLASCDAGEQAQSGFAIADLDFDAQAQRRQAFPALDHRRNFDTKRV